MMGTSVQVPLGKKSLETLLPGNNLDAEMVRACLGCGEWSVPGNIVVIDPVAFKEGRGERSDDGWDTYVSLFLTKPKHLILIRILLGFGRKRMRLMILGLSSQFKLQHIGFYLSRNV